MDKKKPIIGVQALLDVERESLWMLPDYFDGIMEAGGIPVMMPLIKSEEEIAQLADTFDGFIFSGGPDILPEYYGMKDETGTLVTCPPRDEMDMILLKYIIEKDKPVLGICRGLQFINVFLGGTLYQDIPIQVKTELIHRQTLKKDETIHSVKITKGSWLEPICEAEEIRVNSFHHQAIKDLGRDLNIAAQAEDGLVEAIEMPNKKYVKAVQWHPELLHEVDEISKRIFLDFVNACR